MGFFVAWDQAPYWEPVPDYFFFFWGGGSKMWPLSTCHTFCSRLLIYSNLLLNCTISDHSKLVVAHGVMADRLSSVQSVWKLSWIYSINRPGPLLNFHHFQLWSLSGREGGWNGGLFEAGRLLTFSAFRLSTYSRWAPSRGWVLIRINTVVVVSESISEGDTGLKKNELASHNLVDNQ